MTDTLSTRGWARGVMNNGDPADLPRTSLRDGENLRLDASGGAAARPGTGVVAVPALPATCVGPWEYRDGTYTAVIVADATGGIWEVKNGATKIAQFPYLLAQTVVGDDSAFNRIEFVNGHDRPHLLRRTTDLVNWPNGWEFRAAGHVAGPTTPAAAYVAGNTFTAPGDRRLGLAYRPGTGRDLLLREPAAAAPEHEIDKRYIAGAWASVTNTAAHGSSTLGGPMAYSILAPEGFHVSGGILTVAPGATAPPVGHHARTLYAYRWDIDQFTDSLALYNDSADAAYREALVWDAAAAAAVPRTWGQNRFFFTCMVDHHDEYSGQPVLVNRYVGRALMELTELDTVNFRAKCRWLHFDKTFLGTAPPSPPTDAEFRAEYYRLYSSFMTAVDVTGSPSSQVWILEQPGAVGASFAPSGNARLVRYDIAGTTATRSTPIDAGFSCGASRASALVYNHGSGDGKLHFYQDGTNVVRTYDIVSNQWSSTTTLADGSGMATHHGPIDTSAPDAPYVWFFDKTGTDVAGKLRRELLPNAVVPEGTAAWRFGVTLVDNAGAESPVSEAAIVTAPYNASVTLSSIAVGGAAIVARRIYGSLGDGETLYYITEIADNTTTQIDVSTDESARTQGIAAPTALTHVAPPEGVALVAAVGDQYIFAATAAAPNRYWWTPTNAPDRVPDVNVGDLGGDRRAIVQVNGLGTAVVMRKESDLFVLDAIDGAARRVGGAGTRHRASVLFDERLGDVWVAPDGVYAFDGYTARRVTDDERGEPIFAAAYLAALTGAAAVYGFAWHGRLYWLTADGRAWIYEPAARRWLPPDRYPFAPRGARHIRNAVDLAGGAAALEGIWAIAGDGRMWRLENDAAAFDGARWNGVVYATWSDTAPASARIRWFLETQSPLMAEGADAVAADLYVDCEVS